MGECAVDELELGLEVALSLARKSMNSGFLNLHMAIQGQGDPSSGNVPLRHNAWPVVILPWTVFLGQQGTSGLGVRSNTIASSVSTR